MYKNNEIILDNVFNNVDTISLYQDLIINKKIENSTIYYSKKIRINKNNTYKLPLFNCNYFDLLSDVSIYYNKCKYIIKELPEDINQKIYSYLSDIDVCFCSYFYDNEIKLNRFTYSQNFNTNRLVRKYKDKLVLNLERIDNNNEKYKTLLKDKFPVLCTKFCRLYLNIVPRIDTDIIVSFKGFLLDNEIRRYISENVFTYNSNITNNYVAGLGTVFN